MSETHTNFGRTSIGVRPVNLIHAHTTDVQRLAWSPDGRLASVSRSGSVRLWDSTTGKHLKKWNAHETVTSGACFCPDGRLVTAGADALVKVWDVGTEQCSILRGHTGIVYDVSSSHDGRFLASAAGDGTIRIWQAPTFTECRVLTADDDEDREKGWISRLWSPRRARIVGIAWNSDGSLIASASDHLRVWNTTTWDCVADMTVKVVDVAWSPESPSRWLAAAASDATVQIWDARSGHQSILAGHKSAVTSVVFSGDGRWLITGANDGQICVWSVGEWTLVFSTSTATRWALTCHPSQPLLAGAGVGWTGDVTAIHFLTLDSTLGDAPSEHVRRYATAKIVMVGSSGVGKTSLGWRLATGEFKAHPATHGQQFWPLPQLNCTLLDGTKCETFLWDLAGQPDYRFIHSLSLDDVDVALILFDPTDTENIVNNVDYWLRQLCVGSANTKTTAILVAARADRGVSSMGPDELMEFCEQRHIGPPITTSAFSGEGISLVVSAIESIIDWTRKPAIVTTPTFEHIRESILSSQRSPLSSGAVVRMEDLRAFLDTSDGPRASDGELLAVVRHLEHHGRIRQLRTSRGEICVVLVPELLTNLAASIILHARRNPQGLGSLDEERLLNGDFDLPELRLIAVEQRSALIDGVVLLLLRHSLCFRETDPSSHRAYLIFPDLINQRSTSAYKAVVTEDARGYLVTGQVQNVYASLVVLLGYTDTFQRSAHWKDHAVFRTNDGSVCGFRAEQRKAGELELVLFFGVTVDATTRVAFVNVFERLLARPNIYITAYDPVACPLGHILNRRVVRDHAMARRARAFCTECGREIDLLVPSAPPLSPQDIKFVDAEAFAVEQRKRFVEATVRLQAYVKESGVSPPVCFISYAWGNEQELWVERHLATDLRHAGLHILLDKWHNAPGSSLSRFVEQILTVDRVLVVGTPDYLQKYENRSAEGNVVAAEGDMIGRRMLRSEDARRGVMPLLLAGTDESSFPPFVRLNVYSDFRERAAYYSTLFDLILGLYRISKDAAAVAELRDSLRPGADFTRG